MGGCTFSTKQPSRLILPVGELGGDAVIYRKITSTLVSCFRAKENKVCERALERERAGAGEMDQLSVQHRILLTIKNEKISKYATVSTSVERGVQGGDAQRATEMKKKGQQGVSHLLGFSLLFLPFPTPFLSDLPRFLRKLQGKVIGIWQNSFEKN